jgi:AcrR family transcriptional regulator
MARPESISDEDLLSRLAPVFRARGYEGASLAELSEASGLAKAALYHRFPDGKLAMARAVLAAAERQMAADALAPAPPRASPAERLHAMAHGLLRFYDGGRRTCLVDVFSVAGTPDAVRADVRSGAARWIAGIADLLVEAGIDPAEARRRGEDAVIRIEGALVLSRALNDTAPFERVAKTFAADLLRPAAAVHPSRKETSDD